MPFQSKSQMRAAFAQEAADKKAGRKPRWNAHKWAEHTPNIKDLPEHVKQANLSPEFIKIAVALKKLPPVSLRELVDQNSKQALDQKTQGDAIAHRITTALKK
jgi:hypothetical protein